MRFSVSNVPERVFRHCTNMNKRSGHVDHLAGLGGRRTYRKLVLPSPTFRTEAIEFSLFVWTSAALPSLAINLAEISAKVIAQGFAVAILRRRLHDPGMLLNPEARGGKYSGYIWVKYCQKALLPLTESPPSNYIWLWVVIRNQTSNHVCNILSNYQCCRDIKCLMYNAKALNQLLISCFELGSTI